MNSKTVTLTPKQIQLISDVLFDGPSECITPNMSLCSDEDPFCPACMCTYVHELFLFARSVTLEFNE